MAETQLDLVVIGGGPGGYVAAIRAAQLGLKVACVEKRESLGGTCLNVGCIPSKALLQSSHLYAMAGHDFAAHGIDAQARLDLGRMMARKDAVVADLTKGVAFLLRKNKVERVTGTGRIAGPGAVAVTPAGGGAATTLKTKAIVIATGSEPAGLPGIAVDERRIVTSTGALALPEVPKRLAVIGAGVIGLELGSVWRRLGAEVTVIEFLDHILPGMDGEIAKQAQRILAKQGLAFRLATKVTGATAGNAGVEIALEPVKGGAAERIAADVLLVCVGRRPYTAGLGLAEAGVAVDGKGFVKVDAHYATNVPNVYAIGDAIGGAMLAHKAEEEGVAVAERLAGQAGHVTYDAIPAVVYTWPEVASVGRTEEQLKAAGIEYRVGKFPMIANSRARTNGDTDGLVKVLADAKTDRVLGVHIVAASAGELIQEAALAIEFGASAEDLARTSHAHPGLYEAVKEAALAVAGRAIHA